VGKTKVLCNTCEQRLETGRPFCARCGTPTQWATHDQRTAWDVAWYRQKNRTVPIRAAYDAVPAADAPTRFPASPARIMAPPKRGIGTMFSRPRPDLELVPPRGIERRWTQPSRTPAPVSGGAPATAAAVAFARPDAVKPEPTTSAPLRPLPNPVSEGVRLREIPPMVLAVRLLNGRVSEIDARLTSVERTIAERLPLKRRRLWK
jgi:hypothetical protein